MKMTYSTGFKSCVFAWIAFAAGATQALDTTVTLHADSAISPTNSELVTFGLPLVEGEVLDVAQIRVIQGSTELAVYVEEGLRHHWSDHSLRSVTIQLAGINMLSGDVAIRITDAGGTIARIAERPHSEGWTNAGADKNNLPYPRIFALHDKTYLAQTRLISPYEPSAGLSDAFEQYQVGQFDNWAGGLNYGESSGANWLFDRASAMFKAYMTTGRVEFLKEGFLSKQFYFQHVRNDGSAPAQAGGDGCWTYGGTACADGKYVAPQQAKLAWALAGDDSQWDETLIVNMALQSDLGWNQYATRDAFDSENEGFTERGAGMAGLAEINAYEITGNTTVLAHLNERISSLKDMQQTVKPWDSSNGWEPKSGGWTHNVDVHEGSHNEASAPAGDSNARGFSAWMSENIVNFLWQTYWVTGNTEVPEMLRRVANAVDLYGFTSSYDAASNDHNTKPEFAAIPEIRALSCNATREDTDLLYFASAHANAATRTSGDWWPYYSDTHNIETVLILATGYYFETNLANKTRLRARIDKLIQGNVNSSCASVFSGVHRMWNWQHRSNSVRSWYWINDEGNAGGNEEVVIMSAPLAPLGFSIVIVGGAEDGGTTDNNDGDPDSPVVDPNPDSTMVQAVFVATTDCSVGDDPHWQCGGQWQAVDSLQANDYVAVCIGRESADYVGCYETDKFVQYSSVSSADGFLICNSEVTLGGGRTTCADHHYVVAANFGETTVVEPDGESSTGGGETTPDSTVGGGGLSFVDVTAAVIDQAPQVAFHFWSGMPDVNGDGCFDIYLGSHTDDVDSAMYLQDNASGICQGTFSYFADANNYSQASPVTPRITSRYMWGNWYGHPEGFWSFFGADVDGSASARYILDPSFTTVGGSPSYLPKSNGCFGARPKCLVLDIDGDNSFEMVSRLYSSPYNTGYIVDINNGSTIYTPTSTSATFTDGLVVFDVDNDGVPEVVHVGQAGYFDYNGTSLDFVSSRFSSTPSGTTDKHSVVLDYDSDGDMDYFMVKGIYDGGGVATPYMYENDGNGNFTDVTSTALSGITLSNTGYWTTYANSVVADIDLDGYPDILFSGETYGNNVTILYNNGDGTFSADRTIDFGESYVDSSGKAWVGAADYDNDGRIDIVKTHGRTDANHASVGLFRNTTVNDNHWMRVRVRGNGDNTDGLHSRVTFFQPGTTNIITHYEVGAFSAGYQNLVTHAGVGANNNVDLVVDYPHNQGSCRFNSISVDRDVVILPSCQLLEYTPGNAIPMP